MINTTSLSTIALIFFIIVIITIFDTKIRRNIFYFQIQSLLVVMFGVIVAYNEQDYLVLMASILGLLTKGIIIPQALYYLQKRTGKKNDTTKDLLPFIHIASIIVVFTTAYFVSKNLQFSSESISFTIFILGLSAFLLGFYLIIIKNNLVAQILGYLTLENAITILSITFAPKLPLIIEIGLLLSVIMAVIIMLTLSLTINKMFKTFDTNKLTKLKD